MLKRILTIITLISILPLLGCAIMGDSSDSKKNAFDAIPQKGTYVVFGRIANIQTQNVAGCEVYLIKRKFKGHCEKTADCVEPETIVLGEYKVAESDLTGDYRLTFQPQNANNLWLYFQAPGYVPRMVEIDKMMHGKLFRDPGYPLLKYNVILEPMSPQSASLD